MNIESKIRSMEDNIVSARRYEERAKAVRSLRFAIRMGGDGSGPSTTEIILFDGASAKNFLPSVNGWDSATETGFRRLLDEVNAAIRPIVKQHAEKWESLAQGALGNV